MSFFFTKVMSVDELHKHKPLVVEAETYLSEFCFLASDLYWFKRIQQVSEDRIEVDAFGSAWALAVADLKPGQVHVRCGQNWVPVTGQRMIWVPPHSVLQWKLSKGELIWYSYISTAKTPQELPDHPVLFSCQDFHWPKTIEEIQNVVSKGIDVVSLAPPIHNPWALRLKKKLEVEFQANKKIEEYAASLGISHETLTRAFGDEYGLAPVQYRNKLRLMQSMIEILMSGRPIGEIAQELGFKDPSHFHQLFRREIRTKPGQFRF